MSEIRLTNEQKAAVTLRSSSLLVSAAAGSGKTRVLTERLMSYICEGNEPESINRFLIITYTRAAAAELRGRILAELSRKSSLQPENRRLRRQVTLCHRAQIGTIHSFCTSILRENCHRLGISPDFRVGDEGRCAQLREKALEQVLEEAYEKMAASPGFAALVDSVGAGRDDSRLANAILDLHAKMQSHAYPEKWAIQQSENLDPAGLSDISETIWGELLIKNAEKTVSYWLKRLDEAWFFISSSPEENAPLINSYGESICSTTEQLRALLRELKNGWDNARNVLPIIFPRLKPLKGYEYEERKQLVVAAREGCKKALSLIEAGFAAPSEKLFAELSQTAPAMRSFLSSTMEFDRLYTAQKRRLNLLDFSDLEHLAVQLLYDEEANGPTSLAKELSRRFTEIMIDEYQDVNAVQELIFRCISRDEKNVFMVGDVKQSIYRFRLADPTIFIKKYHSFKDSAQACEQDSKKILLQKNFRSDSRILSACNHTFSNLMSEELGEIFYDKDSFLYPREDAPDCGRVSLSVLAVPPAQNCQERPDKTYLEAKMVAQQIKSLIESGEPVSDSEGQRPVNYGDVAILLRSPGGSGSTFRRALTEEGIPVSSDQGGGFFASNQIVVMRSILSVIDNPHRDIPLASALTSPVFGFSADELSQIRCENRDVDFFTALTSRAAQDPKCAEFITLLNELRSLSFDLGVVDLLSFIYERLDLFALFAAQGGADLGTRSLMQLSELAAQFEQGGYRGLYSFLSYLTRLEERGEEPVIASWDAISSVSIMSIHKSKGLEFPVVFLANTSRKFNTMDLRSPVLVHPRFGLGAKVTDLRRGLEYPTVARRAVASALSTEMLSEEMRVLYVAMTRAKQDLFISCTDKDPEALISKISEGISSPVDPEMLKSAPSMAYWLITAALIDSEGFINMNVVFPEQADSLAIEAESLEEGKAFLAKTYSTEEMISALNYRYPHEDSIALPSKLTATMLPQEEPDVESLHLIPAVNRTFRGADFAQSKRALTGAEKGEATHLVMQFINFAMTSTLAQIKDEISRILRLGHLSERQAQAVDRQSILRFFASETGQLIVTSDKVLREFRFSLLCPARQFFESGGDDEVLLQGVVDCCIEENGELTIIDYKTDYVAEDALPALTARYKKQLSAYAYAMERIKKMPVKRTLLCFLRTGHVVEV